jgi:hypothetical protein
MTPPTDHSNVTLWLLGLLAVAVVFLFGKLYAQMIKYNNQTLKFSEECKEDRTVLRKKMDEQSEKINDLAIRTAVAEKLVGLPCNHGDCPKIKMLEIATKQPKIVEE